MAAEPYQDEEVLRELYVEREMSQVEIAEELSVGDSTISNYIRRYDLNKERYPWRDAEVLRELYWDEGLSIKAIASRLDTYPDIIHKWMVELEVPRETPLYERDYPWHDEEKLRELYFEEGLSQEDIADRFGTSQQIIGDWFHRHGIETPSYAEAGQIARRVERSYFYTSRSGYEVAGARVGDETKTVPIHRLVAVAEYGFDEVHGKVVHHENEIPWDNRPENLTPMTDSEHKRHHANRRAEKGKQGF